MPKRFSDSLKWDDPFFSELSNEYKLLWIYILDKCDHAGIFKVNKKMAEFCLNVKFNWNEIQGVFKGRIQTLNGEKWFIPKFIEFQYGILSENNRVHNSVIQILKKEGVYKGLERTVLGPKDKDKEKDKDKVKDKLKDIHIHKYINKEINELIKEYGCDKLIEMIDRFDVYQKEFIARGWDTQYRLVKRWSNFVTNISYFENAESLSQTFENIVKRENFRKKPNPGSESTKPKPETDAEKLKRLKEMVEDMEKSRIRDAPEGLAKDNYNKIKKQIKELEGKK